MRPRPQRFDYCVDGRSHRSVTIFNLPHLPSRVVRRIKCDLRRVPDVFLRIRVTPARWPAEIGWDFTLLNCRRPMVLSRAQTTHLYVAALPST